METKTVNQGVLFRRENCEVIPLNQEKSSTSRTIQVVQYYLLLYIHEFVLYIKKHIVCLFDTSRDTYWISRAQSENAPVRYYRTFSIK